MKKPVKEITKPTAFPWRLAKTQGDEKRALIGPDNELIADLYPDSPDNWNVPEDYRANAKLILALPDLLDALKKCEHIIGMATLQGKLSDNALSPVTDALTSARAALDKTR